MRSLKMIAPSRGIISPTLITQAPKRTPFACFHFASTFIFVEAKTIKLLS